MLFITAKVRLVNLRTFDPVSIQHKTYQRAEDDIPFILTVLFIADIIALEINNVYTNNVHRHYDDGAHGALIGHYS